LNDVSTPKYRVPWILRNLRSKLNIHRWLTLKR
jgi:hypothetical protein